MLTVANRERVSKIYDEEIYKTISLELAKLLQKTKNDIENDFEKALKLLNPKK